MQLPHSSIWMKSVCTYLEMSICYFVNRAARAIPRVAPRMVAIMIRSVFSAKLMGGVKSKLFAVYFVLNCKVIRKKFSGYKFL